MKSMSRVLFFGPSEREMTRAHHIKNEPPHRTTRPRYRIKKHVTCSFIEMREMILKHRKLPRFAPQLRPLHEDDISNFIKPFVRARSRLLNELDEKRVNDKENPLDDGRYDELLRFKVQWLENIEKKCTLKEIESILLKAVNKLEQAKYNFNKNQKKTNTPILKEHNDYFLDRINFLSETLNDIQTEVDNLNKKANEDDLPSKKFLKK